MMLSLQILLVSPFILGCLSSKLGIKDGLNLVRQYAETSEDEFGQTPFPQWLQDITKLSEWPGEVPPYIPMDTLNLSKVPAYRPYTMGECELNPVESCSFDCDTCVMPSDVYTCRKLSQTFDDGPSPATRDLIRTLENRSTFFVLGINVVNFPEIYTELTNAGHLVGTHSWSHPFLPSLSNEQIAAQIQWSIWAMNATSGHVPRWFRPPYGAIDNRVRAIIEQFDLRAVLWDHDTYDWKLVTKERVSKRQIYRNIRKWKKDDGRGLILEHDGSPETVELGITINNLIGPDQLTVAECANDIRYVAEPQK